MVQEQQGDAWRRNQDDFRVSELGGETVEEEEAEEKCQGAVTRRFHSAAGLGGEDWPQAKECGPPVKPNNTKRFFSLFPESHTALLTP